MKAGGETEQASYNSFLQFGLWLSVPIEGQPCQDSFLLANSENSQIFFVKL